MFFKKEFDLEYRRKKGINVWHFCKNCSKWPVEDYDVRVTRPSDNDIDAECLRKEKEILCKKQKN